MFQIKGTVEKLTLDVSAAGSIRSVIDWAKWDLATNAPPTSTDSVGAQVTTITTVSAPDVLSATGSATIANRVKRWGIYNDSETVSNTVIAQRVIAGPTTVPEKKVTLLPRESLILNEHGVWFKYAANGEIYAVNSGGVDPSTNTFRLTGVSATPVMTADNAALSNIYLAQYTGNRIALYDGANWQLCEPAAEPSLAVSGRTTDLPFDIFAFLSAGVVTLEFLNWTSATARATGLTRQNGVWTKAGDPTRRYLGSCRARSATTYSWVTQGDGASASTKLDLWNADNRKDISFRHIESTNTWAYTTATIRQARASANNQVDIMVGLQEECFEAALLCSSRNSTISIAREVGIGFDTTTAFSGLSSETTNEVASITSDQNASIRHMPTIGRHFYAWNEISTATGTCTFVGDDGALRIQSGMTGIWNC